MAKQVRQGDVLINPVPAIPQGAKPVSKGGRVVLAEGEATGHAHAIKPSKKFTPYLGGGDGKMLYLEVHEPVVVEHEEHSPLTLEPGCYEVRRQVEVWLDEVRQVMD